jgi:RHS repeat-associated protein
MQVKNITSTDPGTNQILTRDYTYSQGGNIKSKQTEHGEYTYTYDKLNQLTAAVNPTMPDEDYTYDNLGNRLTDNTLGTLTYNANNELTGYAGTTLDYDNNGNTVKETASGQITDYTYDTEDRLTKVEKTSGITATYYYDPFGRRLWKDVDGTRTYFHYSNEGLIGEYDSAGAEIKTYGYNPGSTFTTDPLFMKIGTDYFWYHNDHAGTPQKITTTSGLVVWDAKYDSFGNTNIEIEAITNNIRFAGQYFDEETGLHYNLNRYYNPKTGRYLRADPFGDGLNLYAYVYNNPQGLIDPMGLCAAKNFFTLQGQADFWAGFGDTLTSCFGLFDTSLTQMARQYFGSDYVVGKGSLLYSAGGLTGDVVGTVLLGAGAAKVTGKLASITTTDGFLFKGFNIKVPFNIPVQRFGKMSLNKPDYWGLRIGKNKFVNRTFAAIKPSFNRLNQFTKGIIPKGTSIKIGVVGPQGLRYPGGSLQFIVNSRSVINQISRILYR